ncbi:MULTISPECIES: metalloregulator ArsR/SmtB family transcription factor [Paenibacillus]|uniref:helix-turn-helix transcriptional regulator n=1 Tax=Paenibacillus TaxID=44249 RepID=UPI00061F252F|nr:MULTISPECIES: metalloregulator ArsR/SmtB family transcription factor [Paenibacillus]KKC50024.1 transcriptional regulator [Paenibacillus sp. D9]
MSPSDNKQEGASATRTRRTIVNLLKQHGPLDAGTLAGMLGVSGMAVRQHLYGLQNEALITFEEEPRAMGRPAKLWSLTAEANRLFPAGYAELTIGLMDSVRETFGEEGLEKLLSVRNGKQIAVYTLPPGEDGTEPALEEKLRRLAEARTAEGYMAEYERQADGTYTFTEKHCPICDAAAACVSLCRYETGMIGSVLGEGVEVERTEHMLSGGRRCVYRIADTGRAGGAAAR